MMRKVVGMLGMAAALAAAGAAYARFQDHEPIEASESAKSVEAIAGCIALEIGRQGRVELSTRSLPNGIELAEKGRAAGIAITSLVYDIEDQGATRTVKLFYIRAPKDGPKPISQPMAKCL